MKQNGQNVVLSSCEPRLRYKPVDTREKCLYNVHEGLLNYCFLNGGNSSRNLEYHGSFMVGTSMLMNLGQPPHSYRRPVSMVGSQSAPKWQIDFECRDCTSAQETGELTGV